MARLAIPRRPKLRGRRWRVSRTGRRLRRGEVGECESSLRLISVHPDVSRRTAELTYAHEVLHAIWPRGIVDAETEERLILRLEAPLRQAVLDGVLSVSLDEVA